MCRYTLISIRRARGGRVDDGAEEAGGEGRMVKKNFFFFIPPSSWKFVSGEMNTPLILLHFLTVLLRK